MKRRCAVFVADFIAFSQNLVHMLTSFFSVRDQHQYNLLSGHFTSDPLILSPRPSRVTECIHNYIGLLSRLQAINNIGMLINHEEKIHEVATNTTYVLSVE